MYEVCAQRTNLNEQGERGEQGESTAGCVPRTKTRTPENRNALLQTVQGRIHQKRNNFPRRIVNFMKGVCEISVISIEMTL